jgi:3-methyladenine DNA glycosylase AlkD
MSPDEVLQALHDLASKEVKIAQHRFGIHKETLGITTPKLRLLARQIGKDHHLGLRLWETGVHEARHIAVYISDAKQTTEQQMEAWLKDFDAWDIVDNCCGTLFDKTPFAFQKAKEWTRRRPEFEKRAGFVMMATLAVHNKEASDSLFEQFFPYMLKESQDPRNFVKKAINWSLRQIGKRNINLCQKAIATARQMHAKGDASSRWIACDALRELQRYQIAGRIRDARD